MQDSQLLEHFAPPLGCVDTLCVPASSINWCAALESNQPKTRPWIYNSFVSNLIEFTLDLRVDPHQGILLHIKLAGTLESNQNMIHVAENILWTEYSYTQVGWSP